MSYLDWKVGDKVVCVKQYDFNAAVMLPTDTLPVEGGIYTIREIGCLHPNYPKAAAIRLREIRNRQVMRIETGTAIELFFFASRFRRVQPRKTDISIFQRLLTHPRVTIGEDA